MIIMFKKGEFNEKKEINFSINYFIRHGVHNVPYVGKRCRRQFFV